jgi:hypothetical protein
MRETDEQTGALFTYLSPDALVLRSNPLRLFRWFVGLSIDAPVWDVTMFTKNRERLLAGDLALSSLLAVAIPQSSSCSQLSISPWTAR